MQIIRRVSATAILLLFGACATAQQRPSEEEQANVRLGGDAVVVLPLQRIAPTASAAMPPELANLAWPALRESFNDTLRSAFTSRAIAETWVWPADLRQAHRRNPALLPDPFELSVGALRGIRLEPDTDLPERLGGELRTLLAVSEGRRYFLLPLDVTLSHGAAGFTASGQAILVDGRRQRVVWARRITGAAAPTAEGALQAYAGAVAILFMESAQ
ncbi:MAG: hypothetical protein NUW01_03270 [Gemmatimonadaceae bacterium]|nr:hypothetical protein [Gemmatimonadaceae bacterium]